MATVRSALVLAWGILSRFYLWVIPFVLLQPFDLIERLTGKPVMVSDSVVWALVGLGLFAAATDTFHKVRMTRDALAIAADRSREITATQAWLGDIAHQGQQLLGRLNTYRAIEKDSRAALFWRAEVQRWTNWADSIVRWRLPHMRGNFANEAGRDSAPFIGIVWQHHLQTWMQVRLQRVNEMVLNAKDLQHDLGPEPSEGDRKPPQWADPPEPVASGQP